jgi:hypothetical protein
MLRIAVFIIAGPLLWVSGFQFSFHYSRLKGRSSGSQRVLRPIHDTRSSASLIRCNASPSDDNRVRPSADDVNYWDGKDTFPRQAL